MSVHEPPPTEYSPLEELVVCSNRLLDGASLVAVGNSIPLRIGAGSKPKIWLKAILDPDGKEMLSLVENSVSVYPPVKVFDDGEFVHVSVGHEKLLSVKLIDPKRAEVQFLDMRPLGLAIHGDEHTLWVGSGEFARNTMRGSGVLIGFG